MAHLLLGGELPGELKHLSTQGKEINRDSQSSGERNGTSLNPLNVIGYSRFSEGVARAPSTACKLWQYYISISQMCLERPTKEGNSPVGENRFIYCGEFLSRVGHVKSGLNPGGPPPKAK